MGRSISRVYVGAYFKADLPKEDFDKVLDKNSFREDYYDDDLQEYVSCDMNENCNYEMFESPYEGLESFPVLIPTEITEGKDYSVSVDDEDEFEVELSAIDADKYTENLKEVYSKQWNQLKEWFGDKISIVVGIIQFFDEMA